MRRRRIYAYDLLDSERMIWIAAPSKKSADAVVLMEYVGAPHRFTGIVSVTLNKPERLLGAVDHWVGGEPDALV